MGSSLEIGGRLTRKGVGNKGLERMLSSIVEMKVREGSGFECTCLGTSDPMRGVGNKVQSGRGAEWRGRDITRGCRVVETAGSTLAAGEAEAGVGREERQGSTEGELEAGLGGEVGVSYVWSVVIELIEKKWEGRRTLPKDEEEVLVGSEVVIFSLVGKHVSSNTTFRER
jgi:hypothetical protein